MSNFNFFFFFFFLIFLADTYTCSILGPLIPLFWISGDVSSGFQSQSGLPYSHCGGERNVRSLRSTSGATRCQPLDGKHCGAPTGVTCCVDAPFSADAVPILCVQRTPPTLPSALGSSSNLQP